MSIPDIKFLNNNSMVVLNYRLLESNSIFASIKAINKIRNEINYNLTKITGISFYNLESNIFSDIIPLNDISIRSNGTFKIEINNIIVNGIPDFINEFKILLDLSLKYVVNPIVIPTIVETIVRNSK
jgi:hypothetical protein